MTEHEQTETIDPGEVAEVRAANPDPITFDPDVERENAAAASAASAAAFTPRRPGARERDPAAPVDPRRQMIKALSERFSEDVEREIGRLTPVAVNMGSLADVALEQASSLPRAPEYHPEDTPRERFYDHRVPQLNPEEYYIPGGAEAGRVTAGGTPVPQSLAARRRTLDDGTEVVAIPLRGAGAADREPETVMELPLRTAEAFALTVLAAAWADPVDGSS